MTLIRWLYDDVTTQLLLSQKWLASTVNYALVQVKLLVCNISFVFHKIIKSTENADSSLARKRRQKEGLVD